MNELKQTDVESTNELQVPIKLSGLITKNHECLNRYIYKITLYRVTRDVLYWTTNETSSTLMTPGNYLILPYVGVDTPIIRLFTRNLQFGRDFLTIVSVNTKQYDLGDCLWVVKKESFNENELLSINAVLFSATTQSCELIKGRNPKD